MSKYRKRKSPITTIAILVIAAGVILYQRGLLPEKVTGIISEFYQSAPAQEEVLTSSPPPEGTFTVQIVDVGQADCIFIYDNTYAMLIDAGNNADGPLLVDYLRSIGIDHLDYAVVSHCDEDHCGGMDDIIYNIPISNIVLPLYSSGTQTYKEVQLAAENSTANIISPQVGDIYSLGSAQWVILSCDGQDAESSNASSIVIKMAYGDVKFLFPGDAVTANEEAILASGYDISADILKAGHHGSLTSNSVEWLDRIDPEAIIISVGENNEYNLPNPEILDRYEATNASIYRTDEMGTIIVNTDGIDYTITSISTNTDAA